MSLFILKCNILIQKLFTRLFFTCTIFFTISYSLCAQLVDLSNAVMLETDHTGGFLGTGVSFADFNDDDIDDLTFGHHAGELRFFQGDGSVFQEVFFNISNSTNETKSVIWADIDNDGDQDFLITNRNASNHLWINDGEMQFTDVRRHVAFLQQLTQRVTAPHSGTIIMMVIWTYTFVTIIHM